MVLTSADYDATYFASVYGGSSDDGEPRQTWVDRARDRLLVRTTTGVVGKPLPECSVVDVGCGYGWLLDAFAGAEHLCGSDISEHALEMARHRRPERDYREADLQEGAAFTGPFDVVLAINLIEHLLEPAAGVESIASLCRSGSVVAVDVRQMFEDHGFSTVRESYFPHRLPRLTRRLRVHPSYLALFRMK
jgi:2-polyprenyl-6-hydroxyphenyl methylase/3-demethylubiquinone-9 3-methyltransferase